MTTSRRRPVAPFSADFTDSRGNQWRSSHLTREDAEAYASHAVAAFARGGDLQGLGFESPPETVTYVVRGEA